MCSGKQTVRFEFPFQKRNTRFECSPVSAALRQRLLWCGRVCVLTQVLSALAGPERGRHASSGPVSSVQFVWGEVGGQISVLTLLFSPAGVPDRYHLRPNLGGHPSALQQQQHQHADSHPQQVHWLVLRMHYKCQIPGPIRTFCFLISYIEGFLMKYSRCCCESFILSTGATTLFPHFHTANISFENNLLLSQEEACN